MREVTVASLESDRLAWPVSGDEIARIRGVEQREMFDWYAINATDGETWAGDQK